MQCEKVVLVLAPARLTLVEGLSRTTHPRLTLADGLSRTGSCGRALADGLLQTGSHNRALADGLSRIIGQSEGVPKRSKKALSVLLGRGCTIHSDGQYY